ncbi:MAG: hypothetical protein GEU97_08180 [Actinophytocola sp.]|nr:hypothetical protein [Actinophytocola sp.]
MGTVIAAGITAGFGGWAGGRLARRTQTEQHKFEREKAVVSRGRERADEAITALRFLQRHRAEVANWSNPAPEGELSQVQDEYERLGRAIEYLSEGSVRDQVELLYGAIGDAFIVVGFGEHEFNDAEQMIWSACREGVTILGRYIRDEPTPQYSDFLKALRQAYDSAHDDFEQYSHWLREPERDA